MDVRFSQRPTRKGLIRPHYYGPGIMTIPTFSRRHPAYHWPYLIDWLTDNISHETLHDAIEKVAGVMASASLDRLRANIWERSPDRAGLHFKEPILEKLDYTNYYVPLADS